MSRTQFQRLECLLNNSGFEVSINQDMNRLMDTLFWGDGKKSGNPEFDPTLHDLHAGNSLWIEVRDGHGETVATSAARLVETHDLVELTRYYRLWYGEKIRFTEPLNLIVAPNVIIPHGRLLFDGAMWVRPDHRRVGFSWVLGRMLRACTAQSLQPDWFFGMALRALATKGVPIYSYGYPRLDPFATGFRLPGFTTQELNLATMSCAEFVVQSAEDCAFLDASPDLSLGPEFARWTRRGRHEAMSVAHHRPIPQADFGIAS